MRIDLHTHSTASDGTDTPAALMAHAAQVGLDVIAITDHDTTAGWAEALRTKPEGLTVVPGAEFSCVHHDGDGRRISLHLLGYLFDPADPQLRAERRRLRESRLHRGRAMVDNLVADGVPISWEQVSALAGHGAVGRPHIGRALVESGVVGSVTEAFSSLLRSTSKYYVRKADTEVLDAIRMIRAAGGLPVFAHPLAHRRGPIVGDDVIEAMTDAGLAGLEVDHPDHDAESRAHALGLARELGLVGLGSSDYHGTNKATALAAETTHPEAFEQLMALPAALRPVA